MIDPLTLRDLLEYNPESGEMLWRNRPRDMFSSDRDHLLWNAKHAGRAAFTCVNGGYRRGLIFGRAYKAHRVAWAYVHGEWPADEVDHINGDRQDNRICNLRVVTKQENMRNQKRRYDNRSGVTGVDFREKTGSWRARIRAGGKLKALGHFDTWEAAVAARKAAERQFGYHENHGRADVIHGVRREAERRGVPA